MEEVLLGPVILDMEVDTRGRVYLADNRANGIHVYNSDGSYLQSLGRAGNGPGEFQMLWALEVRNERERRHSKDPPWQCGRTGKRHALWSVCARSRCLCRGHPLLPGDPSTGSAEQALLKREPCPCGGHPSLLSYSPDSLSAPFNKSPSGDLGVNPHPQARANV